MRSYRSGGHCVAIVVDNAAYRDLGRGLTFLHAIGDSNGLMRFGYVPYPSYAPYANSEFEHLVSIAPDGTRAPPVKISGSGIDRQGIRWLREKRLVVYSASLEGQGRYLCVAALLRRFEIDYCNFSVNAAGEALAIARRPVAEEDSARKPIDDAERYMLVDLQTGSVRRFGLPGGIVCLAKDLKRAICERTRIAQGRQYKRYVLVELPAMSERIILSEKEFPAQELTAPVNQAVYATIPTDDGPAAGLLRVNDGFDTALWIKQRVEGESLRYSIVKVDLGTARQQVVVPESATPAVPLVITEAASNPPFFLGKFTADQGGFLYTIGPRIYFCDLATAKSALLADNSIPLEAGDGDAQPPHDRQSTAGTDYSPSGRRVLRFRDVWHKSSNQRERRRLKFAAVDVFEEGKPHRLYTGERPIQAALWLDERRIVFYEEATIYLLESSGGPPRQIFPPPSKTSE